MPTYLGIEGGGSRTTAILVDEQGKLLECTEGGPCNVRLMSNEKLTNHLQKILSSFPKPSAIGIGFAGIKEEHDRHRIVLITREFHSDIPIWVGSDCETALAAAKNSSSQQNHSEANIIVISGTGSCVVGCGKDGNIVSVGGWGHILGDHGSGYSIGHEALRTVLKDYDYSGQWNKLGEDILRTLQLNEPNQLIEWVQGAQKDEIASLAIEVFAAWHMGNTLADRIVRRAASSLVEQVNACAHRLVKDTEAISLAFFGSVLTKEMTFSSLVKLGIQQIRPNVSFHSGNVDSVWGAVQMARKHASQWSICGNGIIEDMRPVPDLLHLSPTEERNQNSMDLDKKSIIDAVDLMLREEAKVPKIILQEKIKITKAVAIISQAIRTGGRLFYVGAGTSGRLGVLDAAECPPTFSTPPGQVQGIIAGGQRALWTSIEDAEDSNQAGERTVQFRGVSSKDVLVGIAASGRTPFVWGAIKQAKLLGAKTMFICFNPSLKYDENFRPDIVISPSLGPEILTGSTRLKAGTATKLILNIFTTLSMVQIGKVMSNLMVDLNPSNCKMRNRAIRIVSTLTGEDEKVAKMRLVEAGWNVKATIRIIQISAVGKKNRNYVFS